MKTLIGFFAIALALSAQPATEEQMVSVPKSWVRVEHQPQDSGAQSTYLGMGKEIGDAIKASLESVVEVSNKFADTPVGKFTLVILAWKMIGKDLLAVVLGLPLYIAGITLWVWFARRMYFGRWIKVYDENGKKQRKFEPAMEFNSNDSKTGATLIMILVLTVWNIALLTIIF
jgi:hypothetical protein